MARKARDLLIALPDRVTATIAATADPAEVRRILDDEIKCICQELEVTDGMRGDRCGPLAPDLPDEGTVRRYFARRLPGAAGAGP